MGKQSARMVYQGKDHKDIYFQGNYHNAIVKNGEVVWYKLYDNYCITLTGEVIDIKNRKVIIDGITDVMQCDNGTIMGIRGDDTDKIKIFSSIGMVYWEKIATINAEGYSLHKYYRQRCPRNSIVYEKSNGNELHLKILRYDGEDITEQNVKINLESDYTSSYFYEDSTFTNNSNNYYVSEKVSGKYIVHIVKSDGSVNKVSYYAETKGFSENDYSYTRGYPIYAHDNERLYFFQTYVMKRYENDRFEFASAYLVEIKEDGTFSTFGYAGGSYGYYAYYSYLYSQPLSFRTLTDDDGFALFAPAANIFLESKNPQPGHFVSIVFDSRYQLYDRDGERKGYIKYNDFVQDKVISYQGIDAARENSLYKYCNIFQIYRNVLLKDLYKGFRTEDYVIDLSIKKED